MISSLKHKRGANQFLDVLEELTDKIAVARAKIAADTNLSWDTDYVATAGVTAVDFDERSTGQHKSSLRKMLIDKLCHKRFGDETTDILEESQVTLNLILAQMDADAGTLSADGVYEAFRIADPLDVDAAGAGQSKTTYRRNMRSALKHKAFGDSVSDELAAIQSGLNSMIDEIQAKN